MDYMTTLSIDQTEIRDSITEMRSNKVWLDRQVKVLRERYPNMYVAVFKQQLVGSGPDFKKLMASMKKKYGNLDAILIEFISAEDYYWVL